MSENSGRKYYASREYVDEKIVESIDSTLTTPGALADAKATGDAIYSPKNYTAYIDQITGYTYYTIVRNGSLATCCALKELAIEAMPDTAVYLVGDSFDITGTKISLIRYDGTTTETSNFTYEVADPLTEDITYVKILYTEFDKAYTINVPIAVTPFDAATILMDFEYTDNGDTTYTITDWKGTYNGEASTRVVVPDYQQIIL